MELLKNLREKTGAGMVDCKKALEEAQGDIEKAVEILRKKGIAKAAKRGDRETSEGIVIAGTNDGNTKGYIVQLNAETDFVVRSERFQNFSKNIFALIKDNDIDNRDSLMSAAMDGVSVQESLETLSGVIGEKLDIKNCGSLSGATVVGYEHMGGKIGVLVSLDKANQNELAHDIAMQIAAANPRYVEPTEVPADELEKEKEIYAEQLRAEGKNDDLIQKIMGGKVSKYYEEVCLVKQEFIKDDKKKVQDILGSSKILGFIRYSL